MWMNEHPLAFKFLRIPKSGFRIDQFNMLSYLPPRAEDMLLTEKDGSAVLEVECGSDKALLYTSRLCQGSKGPCILYKGSWFTPNEFQFVSGREAAKDWKRSIRYKGKSIKLLISKGFLNIHPSTCNCPGCSIVSPVNRERLANKCWVGHPKIVDNGPSCSSPLGIDVSRVSDQEPTTDCIAEIHELIQKKKQQIHLPGAKMDLARKQNRESSSPEPKKESRLTSIIDQLMSNKTKDAGQTTDVLKNGKDKSGVNDFISWQSSLSNNAWKEIDQGLVVKVKEALVAQYGNPVGCPLPDEEEDVWLTSNSCRKTKKEDKTEELSGSDVPTRGRSVQHRGPPPPGEGQPTTRSSPAGRDGLVTASYPEGAARGQQPNPGARASLLPTSEHVEMPTDTLATSSSVESSGLPIKSERLSPEPESSSPSVSPHSPSPARAFPSLLVPGFGLGLGLRAPGVPAASTAPFSPPPSLERFSPANLACSTPAIKQMEMMTRNYSDFMRSLAAKYNNNQSAQESFPLGQTNGLVRGFDGSFTFKGSGASSFLVRSVDVEGNGGGGGGICSGNVSGGINRKLDNQNSPPTAGDSRNPGNAVNISGSCGITDFSSSQTLLNLVRTASAQSASQLENYLKGAVKRSADGENRLDPLDLSVTHSKRPRTEGPGGRELRDFREFLQVDAEAAVATGDSPNAMLRTATGKPAWMALLDRRVHRPDCSPTARTSPKSVDRQRCSSLCTEKSCSSQSEDSDITHWTVEDVAKFVTSVDSCAEYAEKFREQSIDGATLPLLTEEHLTQYMGLKLGPALKLRSTLARKIGHCAVCMHCIHCHGEEVDRRTETSRSPSVSK